MALAAAGWTGRNRNGPASGLGSTRHGRGPHLTEKRLWQKVRDKNRIGSGVIIDEAGQVSLANAVAVGTSAKNLILVGDQMQLGQPIQGSHPGETGLSCLEYLLNGHPTVPPEIGVFLGVSYRLHSNICRFISDAIYESRLTSFEKAERHPAVRAVHVLDHLLGRPDELCVARPSAHRSCRNTPHVSRRWSEFTGVFEMMKELRITVGSPRRSSASSQPKGASPAPL